MFQQYDIVDSLYIVATVINIMYEYLCYHTQEIPVTPKTHGDFFLVVICTAQKIKYIMTYNSPDRQKCEDTKHVLQTSMGLGNKYGLREIYAFKIMLTA
jgi:hypothetical protein